MKKNRLFNYLFVISLCLLMLAAPASQAQGSTGYPVTGRVDSLGSVPLKLRAQATTASRILAEIPRGSRIKVLKRADEAWLRVSYGGKKGYVYASYVILPKKLSSPVKASPKTNTCSATAYNSSSKKTYSRVRLNSVPDYKRSDPRWSKVRFGKNATIGSLGCVVTSLAQYESYVKNRRITPAAMVKRMTFCGNNASWDSAGYYTDTRSTNLLYRIYSCLKNRQPVIIGVENCSGSTHYAIITGFKGGRLKACNFILLDNSGRADTLHDLFQTHPHFQKTVHKY